jgi:TetR/AcrR family transcriptional regulator, tetracycline repressor protein
MGLVAESGLPEEQVADAYFALLTFLLGFVLAETVGVGTPRFGIQPLVGPSDVNNQAATVEQFSHLARYGPATDPEGMDRRFLYGFNAILEGIRARVSHEAASARAKMVDGNPQ